MLKALSVGLAILVVGTLILTTGTPAFSQQGCRIYSTDHHEVQEKCQPDCRQERASRACSLKAVSSHCDEKQEPAKKESCPSDCPLRERK